MIGIVCYLERDPATGDLRRVRIVGPELDRTWTSPHLGSAASGGEARSGEALTPSGIQTLRAAAAWVVDELGKARELAAVCIDVTGGVCGWLSAPSAAPPIVLAALQQQSGTAGVAPTGDAVSPAAAFGLLGDAPLGPGSDRSIEALAPFDNGGRVGMASLTRQAAGDPSAAARKRRLAVLSVPDVLARVFLDELDKLRIDVEAVMSLWHAAAAAWDPARPTRDTARAAAASNGHAAVADTPPGVTATVLIEPSGRLLWSWSAAGDLLAAGSMRLRVQHRIISPAGDAAGAASDPRGYTAAKPSDVIGPLPNYDAALPGDESIIPVDAGPLDLAVGTASTVRRLPRAEHDDAVIGEQPVVECSAEQVGRLVMDWLAWSAQLGVTPDRIVCLGVETRVMAPLRETVSMAQALSQAWPGAAVDAVSHHDPIGATLSRLRNLPGLGVAQSQRSSGGLTQRPSAKPALNPQAGLVSLSHRAGRADKKFYRWAAIGIALAALAVFFVAYRLDRATRGSADKLAQIKLDRTELLKSVEDVIPGLSTRSSTALDELQGKLVQAREERDKLRREPPLLPEVVRVMTALNSDPDPDRPELFAKLHIQQFELSSLIPGNLSVMVPYNDPVERDIPVDLWKELVKLPGVMNWSSGDWSGPQVGDRRKYMFEGRWPERTTPTTPTTPAGGKP